jgi:hypothetical protein
VERLKKNVVPTHSSAASASPSSATTTTTTTPGISTDGTTTTTATATATDKAITRALKNRVAVMEDALAEMRSEAPKLREVATWMWDIIGEYRGVHVPRQLRDLYHETMIVDAEDWQAKKKSGGGGGGGRMTETDTYFGGAYEDRGRRGDRYDGRNGGGDGGAGEERRGGMKKGKDEDEDEDKEKFLKAENVAACGKPRVRVVLPLERRRSSRSRRVSELGDSSYFSVKDV